MPLSENALFVGYLEQRADELGYAFERREGEGPSQVACNLTDPDSDDQSLVRENPIGVWSLARVVGGHGVPTPVASGDWIKILSSVPQRVPLTRWGKIQRLLADSPKWCRRDNEADARFKHLFQEEHHVPVGRSLADAAVASRARVVAVTGSAGSGKTTFSLVTFPMALLDQCDRLFACSVVAAGACPKRWIEALQQEFKKLLQGAMHESACTFSLEEATREEELFGLAYGAIDEVPVDESSLTNLDELFEAFQEATPWAKNHVLAVAGTALSRHPQLPAANVTWSHGGSIMKVRLPVWEDEQVVDLVGKVVHSKRFQNVKQLSDATAVRFLAQLLLGVMPKFVSKGDEPRVQQLLDNRRCATLGYLMQHSARACRFVADALVPAASLLTRQLRGFCQSVLIDPDSNEHAAARIRDATGFSVPDFIQHHLDELSNRATVYIMDSVLQLFRFNGVSLGKRAELLRVAKAVLAVANKERVTGTPAPQAVTTQEEWATFRERFPGAERAVSYGLLTLDLNNDDQPGAVLLEPTVVGLYIALSALGFVIPNITSHEQFFEQIAAIAVVTKFHINDVIKQPIRQCCFEELGMAEHFDSAHLPDGALVFARDKGASSDARFRNTHMQMTSLFTEGAVTDKCTIDLKAELQKAQMDKDGPARDMVFVCEHRTVLLSGFGPTRTARLLDDPTKGCLELFQLQTLPASDGKANIPLQPARCTMAHDTVRVRVVHGRQLEHWWPLVGRVPHKQRQKRSRS